MVIVDLKAKGLINILIFNITFVLCSCEIIFLTAFRVVELIASLVRKLGPYASNAAMTSMGINILAKILKW